MFITFLFWFSEPGKATDALTYKPRKRKADMELESEAVVGQGELELQK